RGRTLLRCGDCRWLPRRHRRPETHCPGGTPMMPTSLESRVTELGPWFHNLRLGERATVQTAPDHPLGDFPSNFWQFFKHSLPDDLSGQTVLDIGCNGGFYS